MILSVHSYQSATYPLVQYHKWSTWHSCPQTNASYVNTLVYDSESHVFHQSNWKFFYGSEFHFDLWVRQIACGMSYTGLTWKCSEIIELTWKILCSISVATCCFLCIKSNISAILGLADWEIQITDSRSSLILLTTFFVFYLD